MYDWDEAKRAANLAKHGVDFAEAAEIDISAGLTEPQMVRGETRFQTTAQLRGRLHVMIWTMREGVIRVISLRKANARERRRYGQSDRPGG